MTKESVAFASLDKKSGDILVSLVMVPPGRQGKGWGHTGTGACVEFSHSRETMLRLYHRLRIAGRQSPAEAVTVDGSDFEYEMIDRSECPIHALPEIAPGSAIAFAPY